MYFQGGTIQGVTYGGVSPLDYSGLVGWYKASQGVDLINGSSITRWKDLSGNNNHLVPKNLTGGTVTQIGSLVNTVNGLGITRILSAGGLTCENPDMHKPLIDGSPTTVILVLRTNNMTSSNTLLQALPQSSANTWLFGFNQPVSANPPQILNRVYDNAGLKVNMLSTAAYVQPSQGAVHSTINYGYNNGVINPFTYLFNNEVKATAAYSGPPVSVTGNPLAFYPNALIYLYEIIIYNNTGKLKAQIDLEHTTLNVDYIKQQYPNLLL